MKFEIGKLYTHSAGKTLRICGEANTLIYGNCLVGEDQRGNLSPIGRDEYNTVGYTEVGPVFEHRVQYEAVLIWSHTVGEGLDRQHKAFNRVYETYPTRHELAVLVADKHNQIEKELYRNPEIHRLDVRVVTTQAADLQSIVTEFNDKYYPETDDADSE